jgi:hypothetical protein
VNHPEPRVAPSTLDPAPRALVAPLAAEKPAGRRRREVPMLVPGEYLLVPPSEESGPQKPADNAAPPAPPPPAERESEAEEAESPSFLLTLLRALGAIHS